MRNIFKIVGGILGLALLAIALNCNVSKAITVQDIEESQAVTMITMLTEENSDLMEGIINAEKLEKQSSQGNTKPLEYYKDTLFFTDRKHDLKEITHKLKTEKFIYNTSEYYNDLEEISNGDIVIYLGINVKKPENISKMELILNKQYGEVDLLKARDFNYVEEQEDGSYNCYIEYAFAHDGSWASGAGIDYIDNELTLKCYTNENDVTPVSTSKVILKPETVIEIPEITFKNYGLKEDGTWVELKQPNFSDYVVGINCAEDIRNNITYNSKTKTVTISNLGEKAKYDYINIKVSNVDIVGENVIGELYCYSDYTKIDLAAEARLEAFISKKAADGVVVEFGDEVEVKYEYPYVVTDKIHFQYETTILTSNKLKLEDVKKGDWFYTAVEYCYNKGIIMGATDTEFRPTKNITRGMIVTILWRMEGEPKVTGIKDFPDVTGQYYYNAVRWAAKNKIVSGYNNGKFGPNDNITREQLATILCNYAKYKGKNVNKTANTSKFTDWYKVTGYARPAMNWAVSTGVITGKYNGTKVDPQGTASRAEAAGMIYNYCMKIK